MSPDQRLEYDMFMPSTEHGFHEPVAGIQMKTLCYGERTLMTEFRLAAGALLPSHRHPHEQTGYLVSGRIRLTIGDRTHDVSRGDSWCIPGGAEHSAEVVDDTVAIEVFSPPRLDYMPGSSA